MTGAESRLKGRQVQREEGRGTNAGCHLVWQMEDTGLVPQLFLRGTAWLGDRLALPCKARGEDINSSVQFQC